MTLLVQKPTGAKLLLQKPTGSKLLVRSTWAPADTDAAAYIAAVEAADGQALEERTRKAIDDFVLGCKADGIWSAIKASCILAGARTLSGALVPLVGTAPTNNNFVSGDYNRKTGLVGDAATKYLDSNRAITADPQNSFHCSSYLSQPGAAVANWAVIGGYVDTTSSRFIGATAGNTAFQLYASGARVDRAAVPTSYTGFLGTARGNSSTFSTRVAGSSVSHTSTSVGIGSSAKFWIFANSTAYGGHFTNARLAFYSIGESLDLTLLDARVTQLITTFAAVIP
jgi:hypothetical protein